jgi:D-alanyl-D-alanine carboxypeptidase/D-alanyl-D-alanine-endopeptidase (penicillin-binding protein 4)
MRTLYILLILPVALFSAAFDLDQKIRNLHLNPDGVSVYIQEVNATKPLIAYNPDTMLLSASVIKLYTTYTALLQLGESYRWKTTLHLSPDNDLAIKGYGDPTLTTKDLTHFINALQSNGITHISGDIIIDRSFFKVSDQVSSNFDNSPYQPYNAMPDPMMFNQNTTLLNIIPCKSTIEIEKEIPNQHYKIINDINVVKGSCRGKRSWFHFRVDHNETKPVVTLSGNYSKWCKQKQLCQLISKSFYEFYYALKKKLRDAGINYSGKLRLEEIPKNSKLLYTHHSENIKSIIAHTNKKSDNLYARQIFLTIGVNIYGEGADVIQSRISVNEILKGHNLLEKDNKLIINNGSGLSRYSKINARSLTNLLRHGYMRYAHEWMETLAIAGVDGTIKKRFRGSALRNNAWMKTGTIKNVKNIAGYLKSRSGKTYTVTILINDKRYKVQGSHLQNELLRWLYEQH